MTTKNISSAPYHMIFGVSTVVTNVVLLITISTVCFPVVKKEDSVRDVTDLTLEVGVARTIDEITTVTTKKREKHFVILLGRNTDPLRYRIKIYSPRNTRKPIKRLKPSMRVGKEVLENLLTLLKPDHIKVNPDPKATLVENELGRIDTEPPTTVFRNIQFQSDANTFANVTVDRGGELCTQGNYEKKLLKYIIWGLIKSLEDRSIYNCSVTIEIKEGSAEEWQSPVNGTVRLVETITELYEYRIRRNIDISAKRKKRAQHAATIDKYIWASKATGGKASSVLKNRGGETDEGDKSSSPTYPEEMENLLRENRNIGEELAEQLPESEIFGGGSEKYFDESEFADLEDITAIKVGATDMIDWIQVVYQTREAPKHGGDFGREGEICLEEDERIISVCVTVEPKGIGISSLTFHTDYGRQKSFGNVREEGFEFEMTDGCYLAAIKGYDAYTGGSRRYPGWPGNYQLLPAIGFIQKA